MVLEVGGKGAASLRNKRSAEDCYHFHSLGKAKEGRAWLQSLEKCIEPRVATTSYGAIYSFPKICSKNALKLLFGVLQNYSKTTKKLLSFFLCFLEFTHFSISLLNDTRILDSANEMRLEQTRSGIYSWSLPDVL